LPFNVNLHFVFSVCIQNTVCQQARDYIKQSYDDSLLENTTIQQIWWKIKPENNYGNVLLAFKVRKFGKA